MMATLKKYLTFEISTFFVNKNLALVYKKISNKPENFPDVIISVDNVKLQSNLKSRHYRIFHS